MIRSAALFISVIFHPLLLPTYAFLFIDWTYPYLFFNLDVINKARLFTTIFINTFIFPMIALVLMKKLGFISSFHLPERKERIIPYIAIMAFYFWTYMVVRSLSVGVFVNDILFGVCLSLFMVFFFNGFFKISAHTTASGAFVALTCFLAFYSNYNITIPLIIVIILAGIVGAARLYLAVHNAAEVYAGYIVGMVGQVLSFTLF